MRRLHTVLRFTRLMCLCSNRRGRSPYRSSLAHGRELKVEVVLKATFYTVLGNTYGAGPLPLPALPRARVRLRVWLVPLSSRLDPPGIRTRRRNSRKLPSLSHTDSDTRARPEHVETRTTPHRRGNNKLPLPKLSQRAPSPPLLLSTPSGKRPRLRHAPRSVRSLICFPCLQCPRGFTKDAPRAL